MSSPISFFYEDVDFELSNSTKITKWLLGIILDAGQQIESINYIFCSDQYLHNLNVEYLDHDTFTDILTFQYSEEQEALEGDIYISIDRITDNADNFEVPFLQELHRVMVHGVLHMLGFKDKTEQQEKEMREKEDYCLSLLS